MDIVITMYVGGTVTMAKPDALKGSIVNTLRSVRPTIFFSVPRVWEKIEEGMKKKAKNNSIIKKYIATWAKSVGSNGTKNEILGKDNFLSF